MSDGELFEKVQTLGSPLNVLSVAPFQRNIRRLDAIATERDLDFRVYFARKANKCQEFIHAARDSNAGLDTASLAELEQCLQAGVSPQRLICTAAVKDLELLSRCVESDVVVAVDNNDELDHIASVAAASNVSAKIALRISGFRHNDQKLHSRFGFDIDQLLSAAKRCTSIPVSIVGLHFHLDGYCAHQRISALRQLLPIVDELREQGQPVEFIDMGGGFPMSYLSDPSQWELFWKEHESALLMNRDPVTYRNHSLSKTVANGQVVGKANCYPYYQTLTSESWLSLILDAEYPLPQTFDEKQATSGALDANESSIADALRARSLQLRCEPGRSLLDGCGITVARIEFRKQHPDGYWFIGLSMNRTQCRTGSDDFLVDPILLRHDAAPQQGEQEMCGYLVGAYCTESELLTLRQLRFPAGVQVGDLVVFPNTAGYLMHFLESRSHQFPLAENVFIEGA
tara:strand:- start:102458 stop:103828 length:1371 start_codon:yes stop_codon:yes gene_type:complete